jgi:hypothetical protein
LSEYCSSRGKLCPLPTPSPKPSPSNTSVLGTGVCIVGGLLILQSFGWRSKPG